MKGYIIVPLSKEDSTIQEIIQKLFANYSNGVPLNQLEIELKAIGGFVEKPKDLEPLDLVNYAQNLRGNIYVLVDDLVFKN